MDDGRKPPPGRWGVRARDAARWTAWSSKVLARAAAGIGALVRGGGARAHMRPWMEFERAEDIPYELLASQGVRAVLYDLENTLVPPGGPVTPEARNIVGSARDAGLAVGVVSNASASWVGPALHTEGIPFVAPAGKPGKDGFHTACKMLGVRPAQTVMVGDQMITDVLGAQRAGLRAILVAQRFETDFWSGRFQRVIARGVLRVMGKR